MGRAMAWLRARVASAWCEQGTGTTGKRYVRREGITGNYFSAKGSGGAGYSPVDLGLRPGAQLTASE